MSPYVVPILVMEMLAAGLCAPGCGAVVSAIAGGPVLGAVGAVAAVGYGIYSLTVSKDDGSEFVDAVEEDPVVVVQIAPNGGATNKERKRDKGDSSSFL
jgi:hypothetical protein